MHDLDVPSQARRFFLLFLQLHPFLAFAFPLIQSIPSTDQHPHVHPRTLSRGSPHEKLKSNFGISLHMSPSNEIYISQPIAIQVSEFRVTIPTRDPSTPRKYTPNFHDAHFRATSEPVACVRHKIIIIMIRIKLILDMIPT
jgi:hypothetical protein